MFLPLVLDFERFAVVAFAVADFAGDVHVGQEVHFDFNHAVALAGFAAAAFDVEGESADAVAAFAREGDAGEEFADGGEQAGVGGGIGARGAADGGLVDVDDFVEVFEGLWMLSYGAGSSWARLSSRAVILARVSLIRVDLPLPDTPVMQVIKPSGSSRVTFLRLLPRAPLRTSIRSGLTGVRSDGTAMDFLPLRYCPVTDFSHLATFFGGVGNQYVAAVFARARTHIDDEIGFADGVFVVFDHNHAVAQIAQTFEGGRAGGRCRAGAGRWTVRQAHTSRRSGRCRFGWRGGCAGLRRRRGFRRSGRD